jgi:hypothetical protein
MCSKNKLYFLIVFSFLLNFRTFCIGQVPNTNEGIIIVDGLVSGYNHDPTHKLLQKEKPIVLEGTLERVLITVLDNGSWVYNTYTNKKGEFQLKLVLGKIYKIELTKNAHTKSVFLIDVRSVPLEISANGLRFNGAELVMNSFMSKDTSEVNQPFGRLYFDARKQMMEFEANQAKSKSGMFTKRDEPNTSISLMRRAVLKNKDNVQIDQKMVEEYLKQAIKQKIEKLKKIQGKPEALITQKKKKLRALIRPPIRMKILN